MMDQDDIDQVPVSHETFKELKEIFRKNFNEKERNHEPDNPYVATKVPMTNLKVYPELIESLTLIEEDSLIHHCPKKKEKRKLQLRPTQSIILQHSQNFAGEAREEEEVLNRSHSRPRDRGSTHDVQVSMEPNFGQQDGPQTLRERIPNSIQKIDTAKKRFRGEQKTTPKETSDVATTTDTSPKTAQEENGSRRTRSPDNRSGITIGQERDRGSEGTRSGILQQSVRNTKE
ncbi:hypothetical protein AYI69_g9983 [Smittium culicis]|uniref:Uncharacterized protein n=1 Tax=Smittium culicis TaxID=133412 RepID=A0A1R1X8Y1_9FUNG|nr:hypothetical protein AYI69_g9983 [Smittium culicis]